MNIIGVTGGIGAGKTFVASIFRSLGARVIDADGIAHAILTKGSPEYGKVMNVFGKAVLKSGGAIDRKKLGGVVFSDMRMLKRLEKITHPAAIRRIKRIIGRAGKNDVLIVDAPLIIEARAAGLVDKLIVVSASKKSRINRRAGNSGMSRRDFLRRDANQLSLKEKIKEADFVIDNDGARSGTRKQVIKIWEMVHGNS